MKRRALLAKEIYKHATIVVLFVCLFTVAYGVYAWWSHEKTLEQKLNERALQIEEQLKQIFKDAHEHLMYLGKQIETISFDKRKNLSSILEDNFKNLPFSPSASSLYSLSWLTPENLLEWSNIQISPDLLNKQVPINSYTWRCRQSPWELQLSTPGISMPWGIWEILGCMGIVNYQKRYMGTLVIGFNIAELNNHLHKTTSDTSISFIVLDENYTVTLQSPDNASEFKTPYYRELLKEVSTFYKESGILSDSIFYKGIVYKLYKKMRDYPYLILTGYNSSQAYGDLWIKISLKAVELTTLGLLALLLIYASWLKLLNLIKDCEKARRDYLSQLNQRQDDSLQSISLYSELVSKYLSGEITLGLDPQKCTNLLSNVHQEICKISNSTYPSSNLTYVDVNALIKKCLTICTPLAIYKEITLIEDKSLKETLPLLFTDSLSFMQMVIGLMRISLYFCSRKNMISIRTVLTPHEEKKFITIYIEDDGIPLTLADIKRINQKLNKEGLCLREEGVEFSLSTLEHLVLIHKGTFDIQAKNNRGKVIKLLLPYNSAPEANDPSPRDERKGIVVNFPLKKDLEGITI